MSSPLTPAQKAQLIAGLVSSTASERPLDLAIGLVMNSLHCSQDDAFAVLRDLRPAISTVSEVPFVRTQLAGSEVPQERWKWVATGA
jgi:hypothetical protein